MSILFSVITNSGADLGQLCACRCAGLEGENPLGSVSIGCACVAGEDEMREGGAVETSGRRERMARPEEKLCTDRSGHVCKVRKEYITG